MTALEGAPDVLARFAAAGLDSVADVLARSRLVRDLEDRSNHVLEVDGGTWFVKRTKRPRGRMDRPREAAALERLARLDVPTPVLAFWAVDAELGAVTGTASLAPAVPLDDLLAAGAPTVDVRRRLLRRVAGLAARLHAASLHHKDLYLNHLYADPADPELVVRVIDVERVAKHRRALGRWVVKDLAALRLSLPPGAASDAQQSRFLVRYLRQRGLPVRGVLPGLARRVEAKARRMARHVPRTPVGEIARARPGTE